MENLEAGKACPRGYTRNSSTGRCRKSCKKNQVRSKVTGNCILKKSKGRSTKRRSASRRSPFRPSELRLPRVPPAMREAMLSTTGAPIFGELGLSNTFAQNMKQDQYRLRTDANKYRLASENVRRMAQKIGKIGVKDVKEVVDIEAKRYVDKVEEQIAAAQRGEGFPSVRNMINNIGVDKTREVLKEQNVVDATATSLAEDTYFKAADGEITNQEETQREQNVENAVDRNAQVGNRAIGNAAAEEPGILRRGFGAARNLVQYTANAIAENAPSILTGLGLTAAAYFNAQNTDQSNIYGIPPIGQNTTNYDPFNLQGGKPRRRQY